MADLDDFFAKKDRKKAKGKKFTTTEEIAKKLEETGKRTERPKIKDKITNVEGEENQPVEEEDEWRDFEEEKKDYTGLKIGNLTVNETVEPDSDDDRGTGENSSDGESGEPGGKHSGPWKKSDGQPKAEENAPQPPPPQQQQPPPQPQPQPEKQSYKPPAFRLALKTTTSGPSRRGHHTAPDVNNEELFPTLNPKATETGGRRKKDEGSFEEVRNRGRGYNVQESQAQVPKLSLGNKYGALSQDQS